MSEYSYRVNIDSITETEHILRIVRLKINFYKEKLTYYVYVYCTEKLNELCPVSYNNYADSK